MSRDRRQVCRLLQGLEWVSHVVTGVLIRHLPIHYLGLLLESVHP